VSGAGARERRRHYPLHWLAMPIISVLPDMSKPHHVSHEIVRALELLQRPKFDSRRDVVLLLYYDIVSYVFFFIAEEVLEGDLTVGHLHAPSVLGDDPIHGPIRISTV